VADLYNRKFYEIQSVGSRRSAEAIVPLVMRLVGPRSVCDVGCGVGTWLSLFQQHGVETILGIDGQHITSDALQFPPENFVAHDLSLPLNLTRRFDLVLSLEVAEHLPEASAGEFIKSLTAMAPVVMFSAAVPGQGGTGHINERWQDYWAQLFAEQGYIAIDAIRPLTWLDQSVEWYYRQNTLLYCREADLSRYPDLTSCGKARMISVLHPRYVQTFSVAKHSSLSEAVKALPVLVMRAIRKRMPKGGSAHAEARTRP
jgi:SAM-dependent methyltransferase